MTEEMSAVEDAVLLERYAQGDPEAFETFFLRHRGRVYQYVLRKVQQPEVALELTQDIFLKLHAKIHLYQPGSPALNWFFTIVHNTCIDFLRKRSSQEQANRDTLWAHSEASAAASLTESHTAGSELMSNALSCLPAEQRKIVEGRTLEERSFASLAHETGKSEQALRKAYSRAIQKLRDLLGAASDSREEK